MLPAAQKMAKLKLMKHRVYPKTGTVLLSYEVKQRSSRSILPALQLFDELELKPAQASCAQLSSPQAGQLLDEPIAPARMTA